MLSSWNVFTGQIKSFYPNKESWLQKLPTGPEIIFINLAGDRNSATPILLFSAAPRTIFRCLSALPHEPLFVAVRLGVSSRPYIIKNLSTAEQAENAVENAFSRI